MSFTELVEQLEVDNAEISTILEAFVLAAPDEWVAMRSGFEARYRKTVLQLVDLLKDEWPHGGYHEQVQKIFEVGLMDQSGSPSRNSVRDINDLVTSIITRLKRLGYVPGSPGENDTAPTISGSGAANWMIIAGVMCSVGLLLTFGFQLGQTSSNLTYPDKITASWLWAHAPISFWLWSGTVLVATFLLGVAAGQIDWIKKLLHKK